MSEVTSTRRTLVADVIAFVCAEYGMTRSDLVAASARSRTDVERRQVVCWLARRHTGQSLKQIGRRLDRDHTTVIHALLRVNERIVTEPGFAARLAGIERAFTTFVSARQASRDRSNSVPVRPAELKGLAP